MNAALAADTGRAKPAGGPSSVGDFAVVFMMSKSLAATDSLIILPMKALVFLLLLILGPLIGGVYGIVNDQITYTISPEYYTKFKFFQFGLIEEGAEPAIEQPRVLVSIVGFLATWWMGLLIGVTLGLLGLIHSTAKRMFRITMESYAVTIVITFIIGLSGLAYGRFHLATIGVDWWLPDTLIDRTSFISVGSMHNFSYLGGIVGLVGGIVYSCRRWIRHGDSATSTR